MAVDELGIDIDNPISKKVLALNGSDYLSYLLALIDILDDDHRFEELNSFSKDLARETAEKIDDVAGSNLEVGIMLLLLQSSFSLTFAAMDEKARMFYELMKIEQGDDDVD